MSDRLVLGRSTRRQGDDERHQGSIKGWYGFTMRGRPTDLWVAALVTALWGCSSDEASNPSASSRASVADRNRSPIVTATHFASSSSGTLATSSSDAPTSASATSAPSASASAAVSAEPAARSRRGLWIWEIGKNGPSASAAAADAARWGVGRVFIKSSEGAGGVRLANGDLSLTQPSSAPSAAAGAISKALTGNRWGQNFSVDNVRAFTERGIEVWAFGYFYPDGFVDPDGVAWGTLEAQVDASIATLHPGVTGLVVDAESEFNDRAVDAKKLCHLLRKRVGDRKLAYTSFGWLSAQRRFPFKAFDEGCGDAFLPQVYYDFGWAGGAHGSLERMRRDIAGLGLKAPVWPVQSNEKNASVADMMLFFNEAGGDASIFYLHNDDTEQTRRMGALTW